MALAGGVGGAKLLVGLDALLGSGDLTAVVNTGDDATIYGVHVSPDVDIVTYWLGGLADTDRGWGIRGDTFTVVESLARLGVESWFRLGDRDFATCLYRTERLRDGATLTLVADEIRKRLGVRTTILPMSDDAAPTRLQTAEGRELEFQDYFVRQRAEPEISGVLLGAREAKPTPAVLDALAGSDLAILCPSNPFLSLGPILALPGVRDALISHPHVIAVSPIIRGAALKGPADRMMRSLVGESSASAVASLYSDFCDEFIVDSSDIEELKRLPKGIGAKSLPTIMKSASDASRLAEALIG
ncbi:MAG: 2-phospho-L-lactate transferase [Actinomycetota bacterium]